MGIYFVSLPYIIGVLFLFFYVANGSLELFLSLYHDSTFLLTWSIGYEILAVILLILIVKSALSFSVSNSRTKRHFKRP